MSREAAYRRRRRDAAFARGWNAALVLAREASAEVLETRAIHGVEEEIWYRGELVGTRRRYDSRLLLAHMARLDKLADDRCASADSERFDELVALACGEVAPDDLAADADGLPLPRIANAVLAGTEARNELHSVWLNAESARAERLDRAGLSAPERVDAEVAEHMEHDADCEAEAIRVGLAAGRLWDRWQAQACASVDRLLQAPREVDAGTASTLSDLSTSPPAPGNTDETLDRPDRSLG
jgi:hypothetical protein